MLFEYLKTLANDYSREIELDPNKLRRILNDLTRCSWFSVMDQACLSYALLLIYGRTRYYFRGKSVAIDLEKAAYARGEYYKINGVFTKELKEKVDIKQIKEDYKDYANIIIAKINYKSLKVDEVEFTPKFIKFFESFSE